MDITLNMNVKLRQGGRTAVRMSMDEFEEKFEKLEEKYYNLPEIVYDEPNIKKDMKVYINMENYEHSFRMTSTGVPYVLVEAASDYSPWMLFMIYWDGKKFRAYIPTYGNTWNTKTKEMIGENPEADAEFIMSQIDNVVVDPDDLEELYYELLNNHEIWYDEEACIKDFEARLTIK